MTTAERVRLNPQGMARKDVGLMSAVKPDPGHVFISCDLASGEPTCTSHYSGDKNYYDCTFGMVGKAPYYTPGGVLKIDNIYYSVMSVSPMGRKVAQDLFYTRYEGQTFAQRWLEGEAFQDRIKAQVKKDYAFHKIGCLGMSYGMGAKKFKDAAYDAGYAVSLTQAREFHQAYWNLFSGVHAFSKRIEQAFKSKGYLVNDFGYRLVPDRPFKAFNYWIQSSVSGLMHVLCADFFTIAPYCQFLMVIHDEVVFQCPADRVDEARAAMKAAEDKLNERLGWRVRVRVGFKPGNNLYEAK